MSWAGASTCDGCAAVTVVGVVGDVAQDWIVVTRTPNVYLPVAQHPPARSP
jgi:hypothetical protein